jgi:anti-sigma B factor antagonist
MALFCDIIPKTIVSHYPEEKTGMNVIKEQNGRQMILSLEGRIDSLTSPKLSEEMMQILNNIDDIDELIMDLRKVDYLSSAGFRVFLATNQKMEEDGKKVIFRNISERIYNLFKMTGVTEFLDIR